jgi:erythromycin esterase-like protein
LTTASFNQWSGANNPHFIELEQIRQNIMADNIEWWLQDNWLTPRKIIIWTDNVNAVYNQEDIQGYTCSPYATTCSIASSGDILKARLGSKVYTLATTAFTGQCGNIDHVPIIDIKSAENSLESLVHSTNNFPIAGIIDFVNVELPTFLTNNINSNSFDNYTNYYSVLPNHYDGLIVYNNQSMTHTLP